LASIIVALSKVIVGLPRYKNFPLLSIQRIIALETTESLNSSITHNTGFFPSFPFNKSATNFNKPIGFLVVFYKTIE
jgi:hypothetical protein